MEEEFDMFCEVMNCKMSYSACIRRQLLVDSRNKGWGNRGGLVTTDECIGCKQGKEIMKKYGYLVTEVVKKAPPRKSLCDCGKPVRCRNKCSSCYQKQYNKNRKEKRKIEYA